jgi:hypothetical protein
MPKHMAVFVVPRRKFRPASLGLAKPKPPRVPPPTPGPGQVWIGSEDPQLDVVCDLIGKPWVSAPQPKFETQDRPGRRGLSQYVGHDPQELELQLKLGGAGTGVEAAITALESLARRHEFAGRSEPPILKVVGFGVPRRPAQWRITTIECDRERTLYTDGGERSLHICTVTFVEHIVDRVLAESLKSVRRDRHDRGVKVRKTTVLAGEKSLYDVARRVYGNPGRASDIQAANPRLGITLGSLLRKGMRLRLP